jgi:hypothetical protein
MRKSVAGEPTSRLRAKTLPPSQRSPAEGRDRTAAGATIGSAGVAPMGAVIACACTAKRSNEESDLRPPRLAASFVSRCSNTARQPLPVPVPLFAGRGLHQNLKSPAFIVSSSEWPSASTGGFGMGSFRPQPGISGPFAADNRHICDVLKKRAHLRRAGFRLFWFAPLGPPPHGSPGCY